MIFRTRQSKSKPVARPVRQGHAFSILELMLVLVLSSILSTVAVMLYQDYLETARLGVLDASIASIEPFQEEHRLRHGAYGEGSWHVSGESDESLFEVIGWRPTATEVDLMVEVTRVNDGFQVVASNSLGESLCRQYPSRSDCEV